jgi:signal transduction histidine kinase
MLQYANTRQKEGCCIHELLDEVLIITQDRITHKNIVVSKEYGLQNIKIELNGPEVKIALTNIVINAIEAMPSGKGKLKLSTKSIGNKYVMQIEDNGCGISKENIPYIFKPYFTNKPGGLGLGLSIANDILLLNHVRVIVESTEGQGTIFLLIFDKNNLNSIIQ